MRGRRILALVRLEQYDRAAWRSAIERAADAPGIDLGVIPVGAAGDFNAYLGVLRTTRPAASSAARRRPAPGGDPDERPAELEPVERQPGRPLVWDLPRRRSGRNVTRPVGAGHGAALRHHLSLRGGCGRRGRQPLPAADLRQHHFLSDHPGGHPGSVHSNGVRHVRAHADERPGDVERVDRQRRGGGLRALPRRGVRRLDPRDGAPVHRVALRLAVPDRCGRDFAGNRSARAGALGRDLVLPAAVPAAARRPRRQSCTAAASRHQSASRRNINSGPPLQSNSKTASFSFLPTSPARHSSAPSTAPRSRSASRRLSTPASRRARTFSRRGRRTSRRT